MGVFRFLLAISVLLAHTSTMSNFKLVGGQIAVQSFYIISGFYISFIIKEKYIGINNSYKLFITNRFLRLFPIYWVIFFITLLFHLFFYYLPNTNTLTLIDKYNSTNFNIFSGLYLLISNLFILGQDATLFLGINNEGWLFFTSNFRLTNPQLHTFLFIPQSWSLSIEIVFYLIAPIVLKFNYRVILFIILLLFIFRYYLYNQLNLNNDPWTYRFLPIEIVFFLMGFISYKLYNKLKIKSLNNSFTNSVFIFLSLVTICFPFFASNKSELLMFSYKELIYFITVIFSIPILFIKFKNSLIDNKIGELSYPIYISHMLIITILEFIPIKHNSNPLLILFLVVFFSYFLNKHIAVPIEKYRQSRLTS